MNDDNSRDPEPHWFTKKTEEFIAHDLTIGNRQVICANCYTENNISYLIDHQADCTNCGKPLEF